MTEDIEGVFVVGSGDVTDASQVVTEPRRLAALWVWPMVWFVPVVAVLALRVAAVIVGIVGYLAFGLIQLAFLFVAYAVASYAGMRSVRRLDPSPGSWRLPATLSVPFVLLVVLAALAEPSILLLGVFVFAAVGIGSVIAIRSEEHPNANKLGAGLLIAVAVFGCVGAVPLAASGTRTLLMSEDTLHVLRRGDYIVTTTRLGDEFRTGQVVVIMSRQDTPLMAAVAGAPGDRNPGPEGGVVPDGQVALALGTPQSGVSYRLAPGNAVKARATRIYWPLDRARILQP